MARLRGWLLGGAMGIATMAGAQNAFFVKDGVLLRADLSGVRNAAGEAPVAKVREYFGNDSGGRPIVSLGEPEVQPGHVTVKGVEIAALGADGSVERTISGDALRAYPSPSGREIAVLTRFYNVSIVKGDAAGTPLPLDGRATLVAWSPDETKLCLTAYPKDWAPCRTNSPESEAEFLRLNNSDLWLVDRKAGTIERLTDAPGYDYSGVFSPDGSRILFISSRSGRGAFYTIDLATRAVTQVTNLAPGSYDVPVGRSDTFSWLPDGSVVYEAQESYTSSSVRVVGADGSDPRRIALGSQPRFLGGGRIAFLSPNGSVATGEVHP